MIAGLIGLPRWAQGLIALAGLALAAGLWLHFHDKGVIAAHETAVTAKVATATEAASAVAEANDAARQVEIARARTITEEAITHAEVQHPAQVRAPAGPAARAAADSLRNRARPPRHPAR